MKKQQFSMAQHERLGKEMVQLEGYFNHLNIELSKRYGVSSRPAKCSKRIRDMLMKLKCDMEAPLFAGHPYTASTSVYFPNGEFGEVQWSNFDWMGSEEQEGKVYL